MLRGVIHVACLVGVVLSLGSRMVSGVFGLKMKRRVSLGSTGRRF